MKKSQLQEKVQKHIDELFLNLSKNFGLDVSENVKQSFCQNLYAEAHISEQNKSREAVVKETKNTFSRLEADLNFSFDEQTKEDLLATVIEEVKTKKPWKEQCHDPHIIKRVNRILSDVLGFGDSVSFTRDSHLGNDVGADSLDVIEVVMDFEREFEIDVPNDFFHYIQTVGDVSDAVWYLLKQKKRR